MEVTLHSFSPLDYFSIKDPEFRDNKNPYLIYNQWLVYFGHASRKFYIAQFSRYRLQVKRNFCTLHGIPEDQSPEEYELGYDWEAALIEAQFEWWEKRTNELLMIADSNRQSADSALDGPLLRKLNSLWFNSTIQSSTDEIQVLRNLPYRKYLKTPHWSRVRAAMILIQNAVCQAEKCHEIGESWYFEDWESDLHVHHLTYANKGKERYEDLVLLCSFHHDEWHRNEDENTGEQIDIAFE